MMISHRNFRFLLRVRAKHQEMVLADMLTEPGKAWEFCPREVLRRFCKMLEDVYGLAMIVGVEVEFCILKTALTDGIKELRPFDRTPYCSTAAIDAASSVLDEIVASLQYLNIMVEQIHSEAGDGQFEIVLGHTDAITQAKHLVYTHEVIKGIARKHRLLATFTPKFIEDRESKPFYRPSPYDAGSGSHVHISLSKNGENVYPASSDYNVYGMSQLGESFMAGVLIHIGSICVFTCPLPISYERFHTKSWIGSSFRIWGVETKELSMRTCSPPGTNGMVTNFELRTFDGCANPPMGFASLIIAGIDGLLNKLKIQAPSVPPDNSNPYTFNVRGLYELPGSIGDSISHIYSDKWFFETLDENFWKSRNGIITEECRYYYWTEQQTTGEVMYKY